MKMKIIKMRNAPSLFLKTMKNKKIIIKLLIIMRVKKVYKNMIQQYHIILINKSKQNLSLKNLMTKMKKCFFKYLNTLETRYLQKQLQ